MRDIEREFFSLVSFLITSARGCVREPKLYGSFRLIDAASRLISLMEKMGIANEGLLELRREIEEGKYSLMYDSSEFLSLLDRLSEKIGEIVKELERAEKCLRTWRSLPSRRDLK